MGAEASAGRMSQRRVSSRRNGNSLGVEKRSHQWVGVGYDAKVATITHDE